MAAAPALRRALACDAAQLASQILGDQPLPTLFVSAALWPKTKPIVTWLPTCFAAGKTGSWSSSRTSSTLGSSSRPCSTSRARLWLFFTDARCVQRTIRGRALGPAHVVLLDFPWSGLEHFVGRRPLRGASERGVRLSLLQVTGVLGALPSADLQDPQDEAPEQSTSIHACCYKG